MNVDLSQLKATVAQHAELIEAIKVNVVPALRDFKGRIEALEQGAALVNERHNEVINISSELTTGINAMGERIAALEEAQAAAAAAPVVQDPTPMTGISVDDFQLDTPAPQPAEIGPAEIGPAAIPAVIPGEISANVQAGVEAELSRDEMDGGNLRPPLAPTIPLPTLDQLVPSNRVRKNQADFFLVWNERMANPDATLQEIGDKLGVSRHSVSDYFKMTADDVLELPHYRTDEGLNATTPEVQPTAQPVTPTPAPTATASVPTIPAASPSPAVNEAPAAVPSLTPEPITAQDTPNREYPEGSSAMADIVRGLIDQN